LRRETPLLLQMPLRAAAATNLPARLERTHPLHKQERARVERAAKLLTRTIITRAESL
jgi:hypothetical protein